MKPVLHLGDCLEVMRGMPDGSVDSVVCDPPYGLSDHSLADTMACLQAWLAGEEYRPKKKGFMGRSWDAWVPGPEVWREVLRVLKPGGHLLAFAGTRSMDLMSMAVRLAGFELRDAVGYANDGGDPTQAPLMAWAYGVGFPKSMDVSKQIDKHGGQSVVWFGPWFRKWREDNAITQKQVAALFPSKTGNLTGCVANWELGLNMPTPDQFNLIRDTFGLPFDSIEAAQRGVVGKGSAGLGKGSSGPAHEGGYGAEYDITAPATDAARQWQGWGTALKPAWEPILLARKPLSDGTVAANVLSHGTGAMNIDACRVPLNGDADAAEFSNNHAVTERLPAHYDGQNLGLHEGGWKQRVGPAQVPEGRWPANVVHDGSREVLAAFPDAKGQQGRARTDGADQGNNTFGALKHVTKQPEPRGDTGSAARFFYCAKASKRDRGVGNSHPTVKPTDLMRYLCRLVTPPGGIVLDPFMGSGSTGKAAGLEGFGFIGIEQDPTYFLIAAGRIQGATP